MHKKLTTSSVTGIQVVLYNQSGVLIGPPNLEPIAVSCIELRPQMQLQTKALPLVVLIHAHCVVDSCRPEPLSSEFFRFADLGTIWVVYVGIFVINTPY